MMNSDDEDFWQSFGMPSGFERWFSCKCRWEGAVEWCRRRWAVWCRRLVISAART